MVAMQALSIAGGRQEPLGVICVRHWEHSPTVRWIRSRDALPPDGTWVDAGIYRRDRDMTAASWLGLY